MTPATVNLFFVPSDDPTALGSRLAAAAREHAMVFDQGMSLPVILRRPLINTIFRDPATFSTRMFQFGILRGGLASMQGEEHAKMRRIYSMFFLPRAVDRYESRYVRPIAEEVVAALGAGGDGEVDLLDAFAMELPRRVLSRLFGFPMEQVRENDDRVRSMFRSIIRIGDAEAAAEGQKAYEETLGSITEIVERERSDRSDSLLGEILRTLEAEDMATLEACQQIVLSLLLGGYETTSWLLAGVLHALLAHPEVLARVVADPSRIPAAIEEGIRWTPSVAGTLRMVERDVDLDGLSLAAGSVIYLATIAHNFDEAVYEAPRRFDIDRKPSPAPMIFGGGPHYCVGAPLGRMEARVGLEVLFHRFPELRAAPGSQPSFMYGVRGAVAHGPDRLPAILGRRHDDGAAS
ncbi:MAG: cytochrome P450 [Nannocystaceae bacterium]